LNKSPTSTASHSFDYSEFDSEEDESYGTMSYPENYDAREAEKKKWRRYMFWSIVLFLAILTIKDVTKVGLGSGDW